MKKFAMTSLGCKVNSYESNAIASMFIAADYLQVDFKEQADVYIINTCTVTNTGDAKSRKLIRQAIKRNPEAIICVFGCYAQVSPDEILEIEGVDIVLGTQYRHQLVELVEKYDKKQPLKKVDNIFQTKEFEEFETTSYTQNQRAFLKIQEGCDKFCTYCIIPYARGLIRSRNAESIIKEAQDFVAQGYHEIVLTGIHTGGYGSDLDNYSFDDLLEDLLLKIPQLKRLRISSIEINQITDRTIELFQKYPQLVKHLHIPLQAGSDEILKLMKRDYDTQAYFEKISEIRSLLPNVAITTDSIVGFPHESDELFQQSLEFVKKANFSDMHIFPYSKRKATPAASMDNQVAENIKNNRVNDMMVLADSLKQQYYLDNIGETTSVIIEGYDQDNDESYGLSENYLKLYLKGFYEKGSYLKVNIIQDNNRFYGRVLENE